MTEEPEEQEPNEDNAYAGFVRAAEEVLEQDDSEPAILGED